MKTARFVFLALALGSLLLLTACQGLRSGNNQQAGSGSIQNVNHVIIMLQENRGFDSYFGHLNSYRASKGLPATNPDGTPFVDGTPANASNPGHDSGTVAPFEMVSMCSEALSPFWNESHTAWNLNDPSSATAKLDGFAWAAGNFSVNTGGADTQGLRVMGYYTEKELPYYYFMATQFATSDRFFSPVMTRTPPNRMYAVAATSHGIIDLPNSVPDPTIFDALEKAGISWKVYVTNYPSGTILTAFNIYNTQLGKKIVPVDQFKTDIQNGTLPAVSFLESGYDSGLDEHPGGNSVQVGAAYVKSFVDLLMGSKYWQDSVFFLGYDEGGGFYDHVPPAKTVSPDGIKPSDFPAGSVCTDTTQPICDFQFTGYRIPMLVISPFTKPGYVSHTPSDTTAFLRFIETRWNIPPLTKRDAAQSDMTEFFDFGGSPNLNPPPIPTQPTNGPCYTDHLP